VLVGINPLSDIIFASAYKTYVGFSARCFTSGLKEALVDGLINSIPPFNSVNDYISKPELMQDPKTLLTISSLPLKTGEANLAVDFSGFSTNRFVRWFNRRHRRETDN
jgi:hypothetical protein